MVWSLWCSLTLQLFQFYAKKMVTKFRGFWYLRRFYVLGKIYGVKTRNNLAILRKARIGQNKLGESRKTGQPETVALCGTVITHQGQGWSVWWGPVSRRKALTGSRRRGLAWWWWSVVLRCLGQPYSGRVYRRPESDSTACRCLQQQTTVIIRNILYYCSWLQYSKTIVNKLTLERVWNGMSHSWPMHD